MTAKYWVQPGDDGVVRRTWQIDGQRCPICEKDLPTLEDQLLFTGRLLHTTVTCEYGCLAQFRIVHSDPLELMQMSDPLELPE